MDWHGKPSLFFRNPVYIRHMHVLCILDYIHTRSWWTDCLTCALISRPPSTTTTSTISPSTTNSSTISTSTATTTSTPTDQPTSPAYYYFYCFYYFFYCYYSSYWAPIGLPSPRSHRPSFLLSSHYIVPCTSYRWSITSCHHCIVSSPYIITYPASHRWVLKLSILSQYHTHWVVMHVSKLAEIKIEIKINDIYLNITHIGMGRFVMHASRLTTW